MGEIPLLLRRLAARRLAAAALLVVAACGDDGSTAADASSTGADAVTTDAAEEIAFVFTIELTEARSPGADGGAAYASVYNPWWADGAWFEAARVGDCVFNEAQLANCDPPCELPDVCHADSTCSPPIVRRSAGVIVVDGLGSALTLLPQEPYDYYTPEFDPEPTDGDIFAAGDAITATAAGDSVAAFTVTTAGVEELATHLPCELPLDADASLLLTWTPAAGGDPIRFVLQSGNHGMQFSSVVCETDDTGSLTIDSSLIAAYLADFHPVHRWTLTRSRLGTTIVGDVRVEMHARSNVGCQWY